MAAHAGGTAVALILPRLPGMDTQAVVMAVE
jgi:hypothetical protein